MLMLSRRSPTAYGGIGVTTPTDGVGEAILTTVMAGTAGIVRVGASALAGAASTAVAGGDTIITIIPVAAGIPAADTGEAADIGEMPIQPDVPMARAILLRETVEFQMLLPPVALLFQMVDRRYAVAVRLQLRVRYVVAAVELPLAA